MLSLNMLDLNEDYLGLEYSGEIIEESSVNKLKEEMLSWVYLSMLLLIKL